MGEGGLVEEGGTAEGGFGHAAAEVWIGGEEADGVSKAGNEVGVAGFEEDSIVSSDFLWDASTTGGDDRECHGLGLEFGGGEGVVPDGGNDGDISELEVGRDVVIGYETCEDDALPDALGRLLQGADEGIVGVGIAEEGATENHEFYLRLVCQQQEGVDEFGDALIGVDAAAIDKDEVVVGKA